MPTIFVRIDETLAGNDVSVRVSVQAGALGDVANLVKTLIEHPPDDLGDLSAELQALPLPDLAISGDYAQALTALAGAVPTDLSSLTGGLSGKLEALKGDLGGLSGLLSTVLDVVSVIYQATQVDLLCAHLNPSAGGDGTNGADEGSGGPQDSATIPAAVQQLNGILDLFPQPLTLASLLDWLYVLLRDLDLSAFHIVQVPILDDLRDPLVTLTTWHNAATTAELLGHMNNTLDLLESTIAGSVDTVLTPIETALAAVNGQLSATTLAQIADDLVLHLGTLRTAILNNDLSGSDTESAVAALHTLLDDYAVIQQNVQNNLALHFATLDDRLATLDRDLEDQIGRLVSLLQPESLLSFIPTPAESALAVPGLDDFEGWLNTLVEWLKEVSNHLDVSAIQEPIETVVDALQKAVDALDAAQITVTLQAQALFGEVEKLLDQIDPSVPLDEVNGALADFKTTLTGQLKDLFAPVRDAISASISQIDNGLDSFNPEDIVDALKDALGKLEDLLAAPEVLGAMNSIRDAIEGTAQALEDASFTPLADQVIAEIDKLTAAFQALDPSKLSTPVKLSLQGALLILPSDLTPVSDALIAKLGEVVSTGPLPLLQTLEEQPQILRDKVRAFEPGTLLGGDISAPYEALLAQMDAFKPSALLGLAAKELETLKARLRANANPGQVLAPLEPPFASLLEAFDKLEPGSVIAPLQTGIQGAIDAVVEALPVDETFAQLDTVLQAVKRVTQVGTDSIALLQRVLELLDGLANPRAQMDAWMDTILAKVNDVDDASPLQPALDAVEAALDETTAAGLTARFDPSAVQEALAALDPQARLVKIIQAYNGVPRQQLGTSTEEAAILAVLDRFNPVDPAFVPPYQKAAELQTALAEAHTRLAALFLEWDSRYHEAGPLAALRNLEATPENLRTWIREALEDKAGRPIVAVLSLAAPMAQVLGAFVSRLQALVNALTGKLTVLLEGPGSLGSMRTTMQELLDKLQTFNLGFLTQSVGEVFADLRGKFEAIDPAALREAIDTAFSAMLDELQIGQLLSTTSIEGLDGAYQDVVEKLKGLSPETVVQKVQPEFEKKIIPLLDVFDPTEALNALHERLATIEDELKAEMARVNEAYQKLLDSIPSISIDIDIDIDVDVPF